MRFYVIHQNKTNYFTAHFFKSTFVFLLTGVCISMNNDYICTQEERLMEAFYRTHNYLVEHTNAPVRRDLMDEIDWNARLIGIKGTRGVGKTTFLLQYAKEKFG